VDIGLDRRESSEPRLVLRVHRDLAPLFAASILLVNLLLIGPFFSFVGPRAYDFVGPLAAYAAASVLGILLGGSLRRDKARPQEA
jgi:hypothetical protein